MASEKRQDLNVSSEADLTRAGEQVSTSRDDVEDAQLDREMDASSAESRERGDTGSRFAEWGDAERAIDDTDPSTVEGEELRDDASKAHDAYTDAETAQRARHELARADHGSDSD